MATIAAALPIDRARRDRFFSGLAIAMALTVVAGFSTNLAAGRSSFHSPPLVHLHALAFMGWVALFTLQAQLGAGAETPRLHRRLGWLAVAWAGLLVVLGCVITVYDLRYGLMPFFFRPQYVMVADPLGVVAFAGFTWAAVRLRRRSDWHRRLHICGMSMIMGPAIGRLLPMPLLGPHALDIAILAGGVFIVAGMIRDKRRYGRSHPAWRWGLAALPSVVIASTAIAYSPAGDGLYAAITRGWPGAAWPGRDFGHAPDGLHWSNGSPTS